MQLTYLFKGLEEAAEAVVNVVPHVSAEKYDLKLDPTRFSFREAVAHLADWEPINLDRLRKGVTEPGCTVQGFDEGQIAIDRKYAERDPQEQAALYREHRRKLLEFLHSLNEEDWSKVYYHSERGRQTVLEQAITILGHDMYHLSQFSAYL